MTNKIKDAETNLNPMKQIEADIHGGLYKLCNVCLADDRIELVKCKLKCFKCL